MTSVRPILAPNPGLFTYEGTWSYVIGEERVAIVDPGPIDAAHHQALVATVENAGHVVVLLTHGHGDHADGASALGEALGVDVLGPGGRRPVADGDRFEVDGGTLEAVSTPGHARDHMCYALGPQRWVFVGDLILGWGHTTWIGEYPGAVGEYLTSLDRLASLNPSLLYPGHGPPVEDPAGTIDVFRSHRLGRIEEVRKARTLLGTADPEQLTREVYGSLPSSVFHMAVRSVVAMLDYLGEAE